jgi:DNA-binding HxlR family transcriptional regulator
MALLDLLGRTWALGIIWNLSNAPCTFRQLQALCENISPTLLNNRLKELQATLIIEKTNAGYGLTKQGIQLFQLIAPFGDWSKHWQIALTESNRI